MSSYRNTLIGVGFMATAMLILPAGDAVSKLVLERTTYSPVAVTWARFVVGVATLLPIGIFAGWFRGLGPGFYCQQALRGALISGAIGFMLTAVRTIPLADAYGAFFIGPVVATTLAWVLLREKVSVREWVAVALGLSGVLLTVQPSFNMAAGTLFALVSGCCYGSFLVATRWTAGTAPPLAQLTAQLMFACLLLAPFSAPEYAALGLHEPGLLTLQAVLSASASLLSISALARAPAAWLAPIVYLQIISAAGLGWLMFGDTLSAVGMAGLGLILCAGLTRIPRR